MSNTIDQELAQLETTLAERGINVGAVMAQVAGHLTQAKADGQTPSDAVRTTFQMDIPETWTWAKLLTGTVLHQITIQILLQLIKAEDKRPQKRELLREDGWSFDDVVAAIGEANNIVVLTGAGISCSCGIPDFRSDGGVYAMVEKMGLDLPSNESIFTLDYYREHPEPFILFSSQIWPAAAREKAKYDAEKRAAADELAATGARSSAEDVAAAAATPAAVPTIVPSLTHHFIVELERRGKLLRHYTQNIDGLSIVAGAVDREKTVRCHGCYETASCIGGRAEPESVGVLADAPCGYTCPGETIAAAVGRGEIPRCPKCESGMMKPDIVFFGEPLPDEFARKWKLDKPECDLLIVLGSSLQVHPVCSIPMELGADVSRILINREVPPGAEYPHGQPFDVELLGDCDAVCATLAARLGWTSTQEDEGSVQRNLLQEEPEAGGDEFGAAPFEILEGCTRSFVFRNGGVPTEQKLREQLATAREASEAAGEAEESASLPSERET